MRYFFRFTPLSFYATYARILLRMPECCCCRRATMAAIRFSPRLPDCYGGVDAAMLA